MSRFDHLVTFLPDRFQLDISLRDGDDDPTQAEAQPPRWTSLIKLMDDKTKMFLKFIKYIGVFYILV